METVKKISSWISKWFVVLVILWAAVNYFAPQISVWFKPDVNYLLGLILFGMGLTLTKDDFLRIGKHPVPVILGTVAHYVIMPLIAYLLTLIFHLQGGAALGVILVGSCPSGTSSGVMAFLSKGDVALDVSIETLSTLLAPIMLPLLLLFYGHRTGIHVPTSDLFIKILEFVVVPIILGVVLHTLFPKIVEKIVPVMPLVSQIAILLIIGVVIAASHAILFAATTLIIIPVVMIHNLAGYSLGYGFAKLIKLEKPQRKAITFEVGMQDSSLGSTLALLFFAATPIAALPSAIFSVWHNISGSVLSSYWRRQADKEEK
ncbi:MAG: bile acid:sodium symporter family protein [Streptococcaceae bacterium]|jgi:BASS family bile acid:Na+ symporter|nr:bile acid:sodium symporter family protein [Streptococcaceae bacterium]